MGGRSDFQFFQLRSTQLSTMFLALDTSINSLEHILNTLAFSSYLLMPNLVSSLNATPQWHHAVVLT